MNISERNKRIKKIIEYRTKEICQSPESAKDYLVNTLKIFDNDWNLVDNYVKSDMNPNCYIPVKKEG